jgi:endonuclease YncB( thermonuclease family)
MKPAIKVVGVIAAAVVVIAVLVHRQPSPTPVSATIQLPVPAAPIKTVAAAIPIAKSPPPASVAPPAAKSIPTATPSLPPVPQMEVSEEAEHEVPPSPVTAPRTRPLDLREEDEPIPDTSPSYRSLAPEYRPIPEATTRQPQYFSGTATVTGATSLIVAGVPVELYGLERPHPGDRCNGSYDCGAAAAQALQARVADNVTISCRLARPSLSVVVFATCLDAQGTDLGGLLVGEGLARANARESYAYLGAEHVARDLRRGLWAAR